MFGKLHVCFDLPKQHISGNMSSFPKLSPGPMEKSKTNRKACMVMCASKTISRATNATKPTFSFQSRSLLVTSPPFLLLTSLIFGGYERLFSGCSSSFLHFQTHSLETKNHGAARHDCAFLSKATVVVDMSYHVSTGVDVD